MLERIWPVVVSAMLPVSELRGSIPLGILILKLDPVLTVLVSVLFNALVFFPVYICLGLLYERFFMRFAWARGLIERVHRKGRPVVDRYGVLGLAIFIGVPLPATGVWTGTIMAWLMGLSWKKSFAAVLLGVLIAAAIVSLFVMLLGMAI